jgi:hypothetical protein
MLGLPPSRVALMAVRIVPLATDASLDPTVVTYIAYAGRTSRGAATDPSVYETSTNWGLNIDGTITLPVAFGTWFFTVGAQNTLGQVVLGPEISQTWDPSIPVRPFVGCA